MMNDTIQFLFRHGYAVLFVLVLAEQIGLPLPEIARQQKLGKEVVFGVVP